MPRVPLFNLGRFGIVRDIPDHLLPPEVWSDGRNVRFSDNRVGKIPGEAAVFDPPSVAPYWAMGVVTPTDYFNLYAGLDKVYASDGSNHFNITRQNGGSDDDYTGTAANKWNGGTLAGIPVLTNGVDDPQMWTPVGGSQELQDLSNWPTSTQCKIIKPYKNFLVAAYITESSNVYPHRVKWSHPADPGSVPSSWDETDATKDAGERDLIDSQAGVLEDAAVLGDSLLLYKQNATWRMTFIGGRFVMRTDQLPALGEVGVMATWCVRPVPRRASHFLMTGDDLVVHNGQSAESLLSRRMRRWLRNALDTTNYATSFCVANPAFEEMWFCFPESGNSIPTLAVIWSYRDNTLSLRELNSARYIATAVVSESESQVWDDDSQVWNDDETVWDLTTFNPHALGLLQCDSENTKLFHLDSGEDFNGTSIEAYVERTGLAVVGIDREGNPRVDKTTRKLCTRIWPRVVGGAVEVQVGGQETEGGTVTWAPAQTYTPGTTDYLDFLVNAPFLAVRFQSSSEAPWRLEGYSIDVEPLGEH